MLLLFMMFPKEEFKPPEEDDLLKSYYDYSPSALLATDRLPPAEFERGFTASLPLD